MDGVRYTKDGLSRSPEKAKKKKKTPDLPEILPLLPRIHNLLARQLFLELGRRSPDFPKHILVVLSFHHGQRLSDQMLVQVIYDAGD